jgi:hypothetical protein
MEKIQELALRFIYEDYDSSDEDLLQKSKLPSLKIRRIRTIAIETFKIIHRKSPQYVHDLIDIKARSYNFREKNTAAVPRVRTTRYGLKSFRYNAAQIWNELPNHCRQESSFDQFRNIIQTWDPVGGSCRCSACL